MKQNEEKWMHKDIVIALSIITGFVFIVALAAMYVSEAIKSHTTCGCVIPIPIMLLLLSSLGLFVGFISYYFLSQRYMKLRKKEISNAECTLQFLDSDEKKIVMILIKEKKEISQAEIGRITGFSRVKVFRTLKRLEAKGVIVREGRGRTFSVRLEDALQAVFS